MLIKASRIRASSGAGSLVRHLTAGDENESIDIVRGTVADLHDAVADALRFNRTFALRHFVIAPEVPMRRDQFERAARNLGEEFGFDPDNAFVVEHKKARAMAGVADRHWHIVVPEIDPATGKVLSSAFSHPRHEKVSRLLELEFGHRIISGAHDLAVLAALRADGQDEAAGRLAEAFGHGSRPVAAYSTTAHQAAKRIGVDLAVVRQHVRRAWSVSTDIEAFRGHLFSHGLELSVGEKRGVMLIRDRATGIVLGAANRLAGIRRGDFNDFMERINHDHDDRTAVSAEQRPDDPGRNGNPQAGPEHYPRTGEGDGPADEGRDNVCDRRHAGLVADFGDARGREWQEPAGAASEARRTGPGAGSSPDDGRGLTTAVVKVGAAIVALSKVAPFLNCAERSRQHLAEMETQIRAKIAATQTPLETQISSRLHSARLYLDGTHRRHAEMLRVYRDAQERLAACPEPRQGMMDRLMGRQPSRIDIEALESQVATARDNLIAAEKMAAGADGNLARVEKAERASRAQQLGELEAQRKSGMGMLAEIVMAQRMVRTFPLIVYSGPVFVSWAGRKVERKRRGLRAPGARNIWGIPFDFG